MHLRSDIADMCRRLGPGAISGGAVIAVSMLVESDVAGAFLLVYAISVPLVASGYLLLRHLQRRDLNKISQRNYRVCAGCGHDLAGLRNVGRCPECGRAYTQTILRELWTHAHGEPTRFTLEAFRPLARVKRAPWMGAVVLASLLLALIMILPKATAAADDASPAFKASDLWPLGFFVIVLIASFLTGFERDHLAYLARHRFRHCPRCHVPLPKRRASGICTTCRMPWDEKWLETTWRRVYAPPTEPASQEPTPT